MPRASNVSDALYTSHSERLVWTKDHNSHVLPQRTASAALEPFAEADRRAS
jgi:hypothetical protein